MKMMVSREPLWPGEEEAMRPPRRGRRQAGEQGRRATPSSLGRRVGLTVAEETRRPRSRLAGALRAPRCCERVRSELRRHQILKLELLLGGERQKLVGGLLRRERPFGALTLGDDLAQRLGRSEEHTSELQSLMSI